MSCCLLGGDANVASVTGITTLTHKEAGQTPTAKAAVAHLKTD